MTLDRIGFVQKLRALEATEASIQALSRYIILQKRHIADIVSVWKEEFVVQNSERRVALVFLANDVLQRGRKEGVFTPAFYEALLECLGRRDVRDDSKTSGQARHVVEVLTSRKVLSTEQGATLLQALDGHSPQQMPLLVQPNKASGTIGRGHIANREEYEVEISPQTRSSLEEDHPLGLLNLNMEVGDNELIGTAKKSIIEMMLHLIYYKKMKRQLKEADDERRNSKANEIGALKSVEEQLVNTGVNLSSLQTLIKSEKETKDLLIKVGEMIKKSKQESGKQIRRMKQIKKKIDEGLDISNIDEQYDDNSEEENVNIYSKAEQVVNNEQGQRIEDEEAYDPEAVDIGNGLKVQ
ncbi:MAG: hypothetical protein EZS28_018183 [Streblomastix strix]|uniref:CID domain-containing protein n=1 Tax=Streblomastix strix TaxID=222440 RepID=A0A5J4VVK7_9EUKA|nr:MAG: hypothetical protein EZS28_018183 [Streblomastix strix]